MTTDKPAWPDDAGRPTSPSTAGPESGDDPFTVLLRSDAVMLMAARKAMEEHGGDLAGEVAARHVLDAELRASSGWPSGENYLAAAADYERAGRVEDAEFLRRVAGTDRAIDAARTWWNLRYQDRPGTPGGDLIASMREAGLIDFDPAGPYPGIDGASYEPGVLPVGAALEPVVVVGGRGGAELITGWADYAAMSEWIASRGTTASGPLTPPPGRDCRAWQEDQVLARLVSSPSDVLLLAATVPPGTFTTDVRYDIYQAIVEVRDLRPYSPDDISAELARRMTAVPAHGVARYGGPAAPFARAYLARLAETHVDRATAMSAAGTLIEEDTHHRAQAARPPAPVHRSAPAGTAIRRDPAAATRPGRAADVWRPERPASGPSPMPRP